MPGCKKCAEQWTSQFTEYENYFLFTLYVFNTPSYFIFIFHYYEPDFIKEQFYMR